MASRRQNSHKPIGTISSISHRYECERARDRPVGDIGRFYPLANNIDKIAMAKQFRIEEWLLRAYVAVVERQDPLTYAEAEKISAWIQRCCTMRREKCVSGNKSERANNKQGYGLTREGGCMLEWSVMQIRSWTCFTQCPRMQPGRNWCSGVRLWLEGVLKPVGRR
jgi:hypothetical protein